MRVNTLGRIVYIEPNDLASYSGVNLSGNDADNIFFHPEEYNCLADLQIVVPNRSDCGYTGDINGVNVSISGIDSKKYISFFEGQTLDIDAIGGKRVDRKYLTTDYTECTYTDILNNQKKENLGIKSIDINIASYFYPRVTINFTDIRAASLMTPSEIEMDDEEYRYNFFKAVFHYPYPKFLLTLKGFYGTKVTFKLAVEDFKSKLSADTGNYDITISFIGYMYGLYSDIPFNFLMIAPYIGATEVGKPNSYWVDKVSDGTFVYDNKTPIFTFIEFNDKFQRLAENLSKKDNLLTDNTSLVRYNKDKSEVDSINKLIEIYNKFISNINADGNESVKVITNGNLYFIGVNGGNIVSNVYFNKDGYCEKLYNGLLSFNETYNSGVDTINGTNQAFESIALCAEPLYVGDSINPNVKEGEWYKKMESETLSNGEESKLLSVLYERRAELFNMKWCLFDSSHFLSVFETLKETLNQDMIDCEGLASTEASKIIASELGFETSLENVFRMIFAHLDTFMYFYYDTVGKVKQSKRTVKSTSIVISDSDMPKYSTENTFVPPFPMITKTNGHKREWVYPGEFDGLRNSPEVSLVSDIVDATLAYRKSYNMVDEYVKNMAMINNNDNGVNTQRFIPLMISDIFYQGNNPYSYLNDKNDISELIYLYTLRYKAACITNRYGFFEGNDDGTSIAEIEAVNVYLANQTCSSDYLWQLKSVATVDGYMLKLKDYLRKYFKQTVENLPIGKAAIGISDKNTIFTNNTLLGNASNLYYLTNMSTENENDNLETYFGIKEGAEFDRIVNAFIDINRINESLGEMKKLDTSKDILNSVECIRPYEYNDFLNAAHSTPYTRHYYGGIWENKEKPNDFKFEWMDPDDYAQMLTRLRTEPNSFDFNYVQSGKAVDKYYKPNLFIEDSKKSGGEIIKIGNNYGKALVFLASLPRSGLSSLKMRKYLLGEGDTDINNRDIKNCLTCVPKSVLLYVAGLLYRYDQLKAGNGDIIRYNDGTKLNIDGHYSITNVYGLFFMDATGTNEDKSYKDIAEDFCEKIDIKIKHTLIAYFKEWANGKFKRIYTLLADKNNYEEKTATDRTGTTYHYYGLNSNVAKNALKEFYLENTYIYVIQNEIADEKTLPMSDYNIKNFIDKLVELYSIKNAEDKVTQNEVASSDVSIHIRLSIYMALKKLYDNWLCGVNGNKFKLKDVDSDIAERRQRFGGKINSPVASTEFNNFLFTDAFSNDLSNKFIINPQILYDLIKKQSSTDSNYSVYKFISELCSLNKLLFLSLPTYNNYRSEESIKKMFSPQPSYEIGANNNSIYGDTYLVCYMHETSSVLEQSNYDEVGYASDGYDIADSLGNFKSNTASDVSRIFSETPDDALNMQMPAFGVTYGRQNQSLFKSIVVNMDGPKVTDYSIANTFMLGKLGAKGFSSEPYAVGQDMYAIYSNRSYTCTVEMMGCANIMPFMYFQLNNIPMFRGAYVIIEVSHNMTPGNMTTKFVGVRVSKNGLPFNHDVFNIRSFLGMIESYINRGGSYGKIQIQNTASEASSSTDAALISKDEKSCYVTGGVGMNRIGDSAKFTQSLVTKITITVNSGNGSCKEVELTVNKVLANDIKAIFNDILATGFIVQVVGCYSHRTVQNGTATKTLSYHSYGVAIDINPSNNGFIIPDGKNDDNYHIRTNNHPVVKIFKKYGWGWGGNYAGAKKDYMHFSYFDGK